MKTLAVILLGVVFTAGSAGPAYGAGYVIEEENGLEIHVPEKTVDTGNIGPGDELDSYLTVVNTGNRTLVVYIRTNIISEESPPGGQLADVMTLIIRDGDDEVARDTFRAVAEAGNIRLGRMPPGSEKTIYFFGDLPGAAGNDYQGATLNVNWTFTTQVIGGGGGGGDEESEVPPERPGGHPEGEEMEIEIGPEAPGVGPGMPATGQDVPYLYLLLGSLALVTGIFLARKTKPR